MSPRQKHSTIRDGKRLVWYTERLWELSSDFEVFDLPLDQIRELDENCWFTSREPTVREVSKHAARIASADLTYPIILNDDGSLMDGGHRVCKALMNGQASIRAVRFSVMPTPDEELTDDYAMKRTLDEPTSS